MEMNDFGHEKLPLRSLREQYDAISSSLSYTLNLRFRAFLYQLYYIQNIKKSLQKKYSTDKIGWSMVDIWCGTWAKTKYLLDNLRQHCSDTLYAIDISPQMLTQARDFLLDYSHVACIEWDIIHWDAMQVLVGKNVQWVFLNQVLHHYGKKDISIFLEKLYATIEPGCLVSILDWMYLWDSATLIDRMKMNIYKTLVNLYEQYKWWPNSFHHLTYADMIEMLQKVGFEVDMQYTKNFFVPLKRFTNYSNTYQLIAYKPKL